MSRLIVVSLSLTLQPLSFNLQYLRMFSLSTGIVEEADILLYLHFLVPLFMFARSFAKYSPFISRLAGVQLLLVFQGGDPSSRSRVHLLGNKFFQRLSLWRLQKTACFPPTPLPTDGIMLSGEATFHRVS